MVMWNKFLHTKILLTWFPTQDGQSFYKKRKMFWIIFPIAFEDIIVQFSESILLIVKIACHISCFLSKCTKFHGFKSWILKANAHTDFNRLCKYKLCHNLVTHIENIIYSSIWKKKNKPKQPKKPAQRLLFLFNNLHLENRAYGIMNLWGLIMPQMPAQVTPPSSTKTLDLRFKTFWLYKRTRNFWLH